MFSVNAPPAPNSFWSALTEVEQWTFAASAQRMTYSAGAVLCREGDAADKVMVIRSGWTKVSVHEGVRERILAIRGAGDLIGERAVLRVRSRSASVIALGPGEALALSADDFADFLDTHPRVLAVLERQVYDRLTEERVEVPEGPAQESRLASLILELALRQDADEAPLATLTLPISRSDLASWANVPARTVAQILSSWHAQGLIRAAERRITIVDIDALIRLFGRPVPHPISATSDSPLAWAGQNCSILLVDIAGFGSQDRNDHDRETVRHRMYEYLHDAFDDSGVPWSTSYREDRGDGALIVVPATTPTVRVVDPMLARLAVSLRRHNRQSSAASHMQLRLALNVGPVTPDNQGVSGESIIQAARLLDAPVLKERLAADAADLGVIVSQFVYDTVIKHAPGYVDPAGYEQVTCRVKESEITAWMHLAGAARPLAPSPPGVTRSRSAGHPQHSGPIFNGDVHVEGDLVLGSKIHYGT
ncbi:MAG TPA: cyclic nucleotide-binding domain-containing protein [Streptosporangiaceae bacterium]|jgi:CRP-like cAMP-binding protein